MDNHQFTDHSTISRSDAILHFWFGTTNKSVSQFGENSDRWFTKDPEFDQKCRELFHDDLQAALNGEREHWRLQPRTCLAYILLLDQMTRQIWRDSGKAFSGDTLALSATLEGMKEKFDEKLSTVERWFFYMPLQHAEALDIQEMSVEKFDILQKVAPTAMKPRFQEAYKFAVRHRDIVKKFQRFPHRNKDLARTSTPEEVEFLKTPGSSF